MATLFLVYRVVARRWSAGFGLLVLLVLALNPYLLDRAGQVASEPVFMLLSVAAICLLADENASQGRRIAAGALAIVAALTRSIGVTLLPAIGLLWLLERRWKAFAGLTAASAVTVGAWMLTTLFAARRVVGESYVGDALSYTQGGQRFVPTYFHQFVNHLFSYPAITIPLSMGFPAIPGTVIDNALGALLMSVGLLVGLVVCWRRWRALTLFLACLFAFLLIWPWGPTRFLAPAVPLMAVCVLAGLAALLARLWPIHQRRVFVGIAMVALVLAVNDAILVRAPMAAGAACRRGSSPPDASCVRPEQSSFYQAATWIRDHVPARQPVIYYKPETLAYFTGGTAVPVRGIMGARDSVGQQIQKAGTTWLLLTGLSYTEIWPLEQRLARECGHLAIEQHIADDSWVFRLRPDTPDSLGCGALATYRKATTGRNFEDDAR